MTKHLPTRLLALLTALSLSLLFTACGASSKGQSSETAMDAKQRRSSMKTPQPKLLPTKPTVCSATRFHRLPCRMD